MSVYFREDNVISMLNIGSIRLRKLAESGQLNPSCSHRGNWYYLHKDLEKYCASRGIDLV